MVVEVRWPVIQILLFKNTGVANGVPYRGAGAGVGALDLTQYLGDAGTVRTMKALDDPCGAFSISFADRENAENGDTCYSLIEPMDMVEIRMARISVGDGGTPPLVMRGFVSAVRRSETIAPDGTPTRVVVITGQDETKLWFIHQILPETIYASQNPYMNVYDLLASVGIAVKWYPVSEFMTTLTLQVMNHAVAALNDFAGGAVPEFTIDATVPEGIVSASLIAPFAGPFWQLGELVADRPWNEFWVESAEGGPIVHFRPVPYKDAYSGALIMDGAADPGTIYRDIEDVVTLDVQRNDSRVANFYFPMPAVGILTASGGVNVAGLQDPGLAIYDYPNSAKALYGLRKMQYPTRLLPDTLPDAPNRMDPGARMGGIDTQTKWNVHRAFQLRDLSRDNVAFEQLSMVMKGAEDLVVGKYLQLTRQALVSQAYVTQVAHTFSPLRTWTTTLGLIRGTGFLARDQMAADPFYGEGRKGPYS